MSFNFTEIFSRKINNVPIVPIVPIIVNIMPSGQSKLVQLNLSDNLSTIREQLENIIDKSLSFSKKTESSGFAEIELKDEENFCLHKIIYETATNEKNLYLIKCSKIDWNFLNKLRQLDYGRTMAFNGIMKAKKRAFQMKNCELIEIGAEGCQKGVESESNENWIMKSNLFFSTADVNVKNFVELGFSIGTSKNEKSNFKTDSYYHYIKYGRASLKFSEYLKPTQEFIEAVKDAMKSKGNEKFKIIIEEFGQFIPTEIILGGRAHFGDIKTSTEHSTGNSKGVAMDIDTEVLKNKVAYSSSHLEGTSNHYNSKCTKLFGGKLPNGLENFDEKAWVKSLEDYTTWDCIEFQNPISVFQLLPDDLRKHIIKSVGKRIQHLDCEDFVYRSEKREGPKVFELNMPSNISNLIQNKDADCNVFATIIDTTESKNDFFNCQVLCPPNGKPSLIIHCIQKNFRKCKCKLKIRWMVIGYYTDFNFILSDFNTQLNILKSDFNSLNHQTMFNTQLLDFEYDLYTKKPCLGIPVLSDLNDSNDSIVIGHHFFNSQEKDKIGACTFSYCLKNNRYVNSLKFTFYTLIVSNYHNRDAYSTIPFECPFMKKPYINLTESPRLSPKFISLYSTLKNYGPIFLKQKRGLIKIKYISCKCKTCSICNNGTKISDKYIECVLFDPDIRS